MHCTLHIQSEKLLYWFYEEKKKKIYLHISFCTDAHFVCSRCRVIWKKNGYLSWPKGEGEKRERESEKEMEIVRAKKIEEAQSFYLMFVCCPRTHSTIWKRIKWKTTSNRLLTIIYAGKFVSARYPLEKIPHKRNYV